MHSFPSLGPVCFSMFSFNCCFLTCIQVSQEAGKVVWYSHLLKNFPQFIVVHTVKGFGIVSNDKVDIFLEFPCFFYDPSDVGNMISSTSAFSKSSLYIWNFFVHVLLEPSLKDFEHYLASMWNECGSLNIPWHIPFWDWNENWLFPVLWSLLIFSLWLACWVQRCNSIIF